MANVEKSPISALAETIDQHDAFKKKGVRIYAWRKAQAKNTTTPRIVLQPVKSGLPKGASQPEALCDVDQVIAAKCWGADGDEAWALMSWLIQALNEIGRGTDEDPEDPTSGAGPYWELLGADWEEEPDTTTKGEVVTVLFSIRLSVVPLAFDPGHLGNWPTGKIDSVSQDNPEYRENS